MPNKLRVLSVHMSIEGKKRAAASEEDDLKATEEGVPTLLFYVVV